MQISNVQQLYDAGTGKPRFRAIVEGANLFFSEQARLRLEADGVIVFKDASANKGGVTSSSLEVLGALALTDDQFLSGMCVGADGKERVVLRARAVFRAADSALMWRTGTVPALRRDYVEEVIKRIEFNAKAEFDCLWREHLRTKQSLTLLR